MPVKNRLSYLKARHAEPSAMWHSAALVDVGHRGNPWLRELRLRSRDFDSHTQHFERRAVSWHSADLPVVQRSNREAADLFVTLKAEWKADTLLASSLHQIVMHPSYQRIIGLGPQAVPFILDDLHRNGPDHWFWALAAITGEDAGAGEMTLSGATQRWLQWGSREGYVQ